jgi:transcriptional regulator with XRE-family HTH domain
MNKKSWLEEKIGLWEDDIEFLTEEKILDFTERIISEMDNKSISKSQLADSLGKTKPFITKLLKGNANMTLKTIVSIANALECNLFLDLYPKGFRAHTFFVSSDFTPVKIDYSALEHIDACAA